MIDVLPPKHLRPLRLPVVGRGALAEVVRDMHGAFAAHVAREEGRCGFFAFLTTAAPRYRCMLDHLRADHAHLARSIASLRIRLHRAHPAQLDALLAETDAVAAAIEEHEALEREMLRDALEAP